MIILHIHHFLPPEATLVRIAHRRARRDDDWAGIALATAAGLGVGLAAGLVVSELLGSLNAERLRYALRRWRGKSSPTYLEPGELERAVEEALKSDPATARLEIGVRAAGPGLVELTGTAPDEETRARAGARARATPGADIVVNRILVEGRDLPVRDSAPTSAG